MFTIANYIHKFHPVTHLKNFTSESLACSQLYAHVYRPIYCSVLIFFVRPNKQDYWKIGVSREPHYPVGIFKTNGLILRSALLGINYSAFPRQTLVWDSFSFAELKWLGSCFSSRFLQSSVFCLEFDRMLRLLRVP